MSGLFLPGQEKPNLRKSENNLTTFTIPSLVNVSEVIQNAIKTLKDTQGTAKIVLIVDQLDLLLAAGGDIVSAVEIGELLMNLREVCIPSNL